MYVRKSKCRFNMYVLYENLNAVFNMYVRKSKCRFNMYVLYENQNADLICMYCTKI